MANTKPATEAAEGIDIEALKAEIKAQLKAEMKAEKKVVDDTASRTATKDPYLEEKVTVQLFKDGGRYKDDVYVSVNGENCVIKRGIPVQIKRKFAIVLDQSQVQDTYAAEVSSQFESAYEAKAKQYNV